ncbi:DUF1592 domain-containing protein [Rhodopirellula sp. JC740]|uniref:DUF1592 domain-containing protein n=2 Tax=Rhodopirellula halodulae TaxID=2894198 RepID=A0ABS8NIB6_9BACT|nr:DUF1592 domain-containing protein [Rhodopirellula sp. JC740]
MPAKPFPVNALVRFVLLGCCSLWAMSALAVEKSPASAPTLQELKAEGARQSKYLHPTSRSTPTETPEADLATFQETIAPIFEASCIDCHNDDNAEGNISIESLDPNLLEGDDVDWWVEVLAVLNNGEMPPPEDMEMDDADRRTVVEWLSGEVQTASMFRRATGGHSSFRRLTRYETNYALQDLLGLPNQFAGDLPPEAHSDDGFQNSSEMLHMSVKQLETYQTLARQALRRAIALEERPAPLHWSISMRDASQIDWKQQQASVDQAAEKLKDDPEKQRAKIEEMRASFLRPTNQTHYRNLKTGANVPTSWAYQGARYSFAPEEAPTVMPPDFDHVAILPGARSRRLIVELGNQIPDTGVMRVRVRAARVLKDGQAADSYPPSLQLEFGWRASNEGRADMRVSDADIPITATVDAPEIYEFEFQLGDIYPRNSVRKTSPMGKMPNPSEYIRFVNSSVSDQAVQIDHVEIVAPVITQWPPESHTRIFFDSPHRENETRYVSEVLAAFMQKAWRRPPTPEELRRKEQLFRTLRPHCGSMEEAVLEVLSTVLASPHFLYVVRTKSPSTDSDSQTAMASSPKLTPHELATRLSLFLWCSIPDDELLTLASTGALQEPDVLREQVQRMLADPKSRRLSEQFVHQWLDMQLLDFLNIKETTPRLNTPLKEAMQEEPIAFFQELLQQDESVLQFIHAEFAMLNERLARHYGWNTVHGNHFRRVPIGSDPRRGGLLTQAGLLAMNSAGADSHPLKRGVWLLESILNDPPPPPPPAVPEIDLADPRIAEMTLIERMADHRNHPACMSCHSKIDPWGIAFENYDSVGRWRTKINDKPVVASATLFNQQELAGIDGLKRYLLSERQDQFVRALVHKLATYGLGRPLTFADHAHIDQITAEVRHRGDGLSTMVQQVATSDLFQSN